MLLEVYFSEIQIRLDLDANRIMKECGPTEEIQIFNTSQIQVNNHAAPHSLFLEILRSAISIEDSRQPNNDSFLY